MLIVKTDTGKTCQFPFTYNNNKYSSCIITGLNNPDNLPQCMTTAGSWDFCNGMINSLIIKNVFLNKIKIF